MKGAELNVVLQQQDPDVVFITETKLTPDYVVSQYVDCTAYNLFRKDRVSGPGGGVLIMVNLRPSGGGHMLPPCRVFCV